MENRFETFTVLMNRISRNIRKIKAQEMAEYGLRSVHVSCLHYLYTSEQLTATELCERCEEDKAAISRAVEYLEDNGYLVCESKSAKRYKSPLILTDRGALVGKKIADKIEHVLTEINDTMTEEERLLFYRCLASVSNGLEAVAKKNGKKES